MHKKHHIIQFILIFTIFACITSLVGCKKNASQNTDSIQADSSFHIHYAKGFHVLKFAEYIEVKVSNPWDSTQVLQKYILVDKEKKLPTNLPKGTLVRTPLNSIVAYTTINCSTLNELQSIDIIKGVCEPQYIKTPHIKNGVEKGNIVNIGSGESPDVEKIIMLNPEAIFTNPISGQSYGRITKTNIPIIETPDYTEAHPLGRAEWIRFYSLFIGKEQLADSLFQKIVDNYNEIKRIISENKHHPTVLTDKRFHGVWRIPGGKSYMANMLKDAGGKHIWGDNDSNTFLPLTFEAVFDKAINADLWLIRYNAPNDMTYNQLQNEFKAYAQFDAYKKRNIWGCNTTFSDYYEDLPIHPDYILKDFAAIFHPELFADYTPRYYKKLEE